MLSGRRLDLLDPSPLDIEIEDIAHGLARVARWNGQTRGEHAFSVAQHSLIVEASVRFADDDPRWRLAALLHDGPEYVIGDMISPFKSVVGGDYRLVEERLQRAIHLRFGLPATLPPAILKAIKTADRLSAFHEATRLAGFSTEEAGAFFGRPAEGAVSATSLEPKPAEVVGRLFLARFRELDAGTVAAGRPATGGKT
ncbi:HD family hydrolase [Aureimonas sp. Leaf454]|uniref:HD family hydrolase n=1 Tax=Aureimonas sp. Leaf454 TaxID=1736381 RepID=UPI0012E3F1E2|nr:HD family hydrolase [Aureimonas sp. Leaf454]